MSDIILETVNLVKSFGGHRAVDGVSIAVPRGSISLIIGPNGSGKTTLVNVITGIYRADRGRVYFEGKDITNASPHERYRLGIVRTFQIPQPLKRLSVLENVVLADAEHPGESALRALVPRLWIRRERELVERAYKILEVLKLDHLWDQESYKLSGGQLKLLEVARALMVSAKMIIMDEPLAGVNPAAAHEILQRIQDVRSKLGTTFLMVEHRLDVVMRYVDYVYVMHNGKIIAQGRPDEIVNNHLVAEAYLS